MNERESELRGRVPDVYLGDEERLRIRLCSVSVDSIPRGGGRALFEVFSTRNELATALTITVEAPKFRAAAASAIPEPNYEQITAEAVARLREDLRAMLEALDGMPDDVLRRGRPFPDDRGVEMPREGEKGHGDPGPPYWAFRMDPADPTARLIGSTKGRFRWCSASRGRWWARSSCRPVATCTLGSHRVRRDLRRQDLGASTDENGQHDPVMQARRVVTCQPPLPHRAGRECRAVPDPAAAACGSLLPRTLLPEIEKAADFS